MYLKNVVRSSFYSNFFYTAFYKFAFVHKKDSVTVDIETIMDGVIDGMG